MGDDDERKRLVMGEITGLVQELYDLDEEPATVTGWALIATHSRIEEGDFASGTGLYNTPMSVTLLETLLRDGARTIDEEIRHGLRRSLDDDDG